MMRMTTGYRLSIPNCQKIAEIRALRRGSDYTRHPKLATIIRNSFLITDFRHSIVKILVNPKGFTAFCASA